MLKAWSESLLHLERIATASDRSHKRGVPSPNRNSCLNQRSPLPLISDVLGHWNDMNVSSRQHEHNQDIQCVAEVSGCVHVLSADLCLVFELVGLFFVYAKKDCFLPVK